VLGFVKERLSGAVESVANERKGTYAPAKDDCDGHDSLGTAQRIGGIVARPNHELHNGSAAESEQDLLREFPE
jgi:hypothetical protein